MSLQSSFVVVLMLAAVPAGAQTRSAVPVPAAVPAGTAVVTSAVTGAVAGVVRDSSGGAIPGATVHIVNETTTATTEAVSSEFGAYQAAALTPGQYRIETALDGFEPNVRRVTLAPGQAAAVDVTLTPSRFTEGVIVTATVPESVPPWPSLIV